MFKINDLVNIGGSSARRNECHRITEFSSSCLYCRVETKARFQAVGWWHVNDIKPATHQQKLWFSGNEVNR
jgi:hypothetical protein